MLSNRKNRLFHTLFLALLALSVTGCAHLFGDHGSARGAATPIDDGAATPDRHGQAPGYFRMRLGRFTLTALYDGSIEIPSTQLKGASRAAIDRALRIVKQPANVSTAVNAFLVDDGERVILIDSGAGAMQGDTLGKLQANLAASGYAPEDVTAVLLTHLHPDHAGGLIAEHGLAFPNAELYVAQAEADFWLSGDRLNTDQPYDQGLRRIIAEYQARGSFHTFAGGTPPIEGIESVVLRGHTPGHTGYFINADGEMLLFWGDIVHSPGTQFANPDITVAFDVDQKAARVTRNKLLRGAAQTGIWVAGAHMPFPGIGRILSVSNTSYRWLPVDYSQALAGPAQRQAAGR